MPSLATLFRILRSQGLSWALTRAGFEIRRRSGLLKRSFPARPWREDGPLRGLTLDPKLEAAPAYLDYRKSPRAPGFFFSTHDWPIFREALRERAWPGEAVVQEADEICRSRFRLFGHLPVQFEGDPQWGNPVGDPEPFPNRHWTEIGDFEHGDIKRVWELSRFQFAFPLVRAYWRTSDDQYADCFWNLLESWRRANPPQIGPNWKCGQEAAIRLMSWCFALYGFLGSPASNADRVARLGEMIHVSAERIRGHLAFGLSQRNNHGILECVGLISAGVLFPELKQAGNWREVGTRHLLRQIDELFCADGTFVQFSVNYQRLALQAILWADRLARCNQLRLGLDQHPVLHRSVEQLFLLQDEDSGQLPNLGHNDGALLLPLSGCRYEDFRPAIEALHYWLHGRILYPPGPWREDLLWLFGAAALGAPREIPPRPSLLALKGGICSLRDETGFLVLRGGSGRHRPAHADMGHVDVWRNGRNLAWDPGTFSYNQSPHWVNVLSRTRYHNTVTVNGEDQMSRLGRFLWLERPECRIEPVRLTSAGFSGLLCRHDGYCDRLGFICSRLVLSLGGGQWLVVDRLRGPDPACQTLNWNLRREGAEWEEFDSCLRISYSSGEQVLVASSPVAAYGVREASEESPQAWCSRRYFERAPELSVQASVRASSNFFATFFSVSRELMRLDRERLEVRCVDGWFRLSLDWNSAERMFTDATWEHHRGFR